MGENFLSLAQGARRLPNPRRTGKSNLFVLNGLQNEYIRILCLRCKRLQSCGESWVRRTFSSTLLSELRFPDCRPPNDCEASPCLTAQSDRDPLRWCRIPMDFCMGIQPLRHTALVNPTEFFYS